MNFKTCLFVTVVYFNTFNLKSFSFLRILLYLHFDTSLQRHKMTFHGDTRKVLSFILKFSR